MSNFWATASTTERQQNDVKFNWSIVEFIFACFIFFQVSESGKSSLGHKPPSGPCCTETVEPSADQDSPSSRATHTPALSWVFV